MQPASLSLWLTAAVTPLAIALATAALARDRGPDNTISNCRNNPRESSSSEDNTASSNRDSNNDSDRLNLPDIARPRVILSAAQVQVDLESRLQPYWRDQDKTLRNFRPPTTVNQGSSQTDSLQTQAALTS